MKLVIVTQHRENYGSHDWDWEGQCPQYWKNKGREVYVVKDITENQYKKILNHGIPNLKNLIEYNSNAFTETIADWCFKNDDEDVCEEWESPIVLKYNKNIGSWTATRIRYNDEYNSFPKEILSYTQTWDLLPEGKTKNDSASCVVEGYGVVHYSKIHDVLKEIKECA